MGDTFDAPLAEENAAEEIYQYLKTYDFPYLAIIATYSYAT